MGCNCNDKTSHTHEAHKIAKGKKDCPCGCGGACGCGDTSGMMVYQGQKCPCGCGGICGVSCNCDHCYEKQEIVGSLGSLGRFDEYPRARAGLFDPRKIGRPWPEPHPDPLIPYVRANEGLLPYEAYNEFQHRRNSMHGWDGALGANNVSDVSSILFQMLSTLTSPDLAYDYMRQNFDTPDDRFWYINPEGRKVATKVIPPEEMFFGFVPGTHPQGYYLLMIRCGGPENKVCFYDFDASRISADSQERSYLAACFDNLMTIGVGNVQANEMMQNLTYHYPIAFDTKTHRFLSTNITPKNSRNGKADMYSRFAYNHESSSFESVADVILEHIISATADQIHKRTEISQKLKDFMLIFLNACIGGRDVEDVANEISQAIVERLKTDFAIARRRAKIVFEPEISGVDKEYKGDYGSFMAFAEVDDTKLAQAFVELQYDLGRAILAVLRKRRVAFQNIYEEVLNIPVLKQQAAITAQKQQELDQVKQGLTIAQQKIATLEKEKAEIQQARSDSGVDIDQDYANKLKEIKAKDQEIAALKRKNTEIQGQVQSQVKKVETKMSKDTSVATAIAGIFAVSTIGLAYLHFVKKS